MDNVQSKKCSNQPAILPKGFEIHEIHQYFMKSTLHKLKVEMHHRTHLIIVEIQQIHNILLSVYEIQSRNWQWKLMRLVLNAFD